MKRTIRLLLKTFSIIFFSTNVNATEFEFLDTFTIENSMSTESGSLNQLAKTLSIKNEKLGPVLTPMLSESGSQATSQSLNTYQFFTKTQNGSLIQVYVSLKSIDEYELNDLRSRGLEIEIINTELNKVQGWVNSDSVSELLLLDNVIKITAPNYATNRIGSVQTEGDEILRANLLRAQGFAGRGVKIGIVSDGSNALSAAQASGDLPAQVTQFGSCSGAVTGSTCNEGTAMAEIIHDIAPEAELAIGAISTSLEFIQRINQLATTFRADIIVDDIGFLTEPFFQDGDVAMAVSALPKRVLYVSAAGNSANNHYEAQYRGVSSPLATVGTLHDFGTVAGEASQPALGFVVPPNSTSCVILQWNDLFTQSSSDYDLIIIDQEGELVDGSFSGGPFAIEVACSTNNSSEEIVNFALVNQFSGLNRRIEMLVTNAGGIQFPVASGSIFGHPATERAIAVGTINASEPGNNSIADFSSQGPSRIDFPGLVNRPKPDLIGIDGVSVTGAGGFPSTFFGTSAAAPHVAAVAAQLMSSKPLASVENVRNALTSGAIDLGAFGFDSIYGFGRVDAVQAEELLVGGSLTAPLLLLLLDED